MRQLTLDVRPSVPPTLQDFAVGDNQALLAALLRHASVTDGSVLYLWGEDGCGKTHLLQALVNESRLAGRTATYFAAPAIPDTAGDHLLAVDDIDAADAAAQAHLFRLLITAREAGAALVLAGNAPPQGLPLREDVRTRVGQGLIFRINALRDADKAALLKRQATRRGIMLEDELVEYLLRHGRRDLAWLMAVLDALDEASLTQSRRVTLPLLRELLRDTCEPELPFHPAKP